MGTLKERKRQHKRAQLVGTSEDLASVGLDVSDFIPGPKLRAKFGISRPLRSRFEGWPNCEGLE
jgi:hypothetical protein